MNVIPVHVPPLRERREGIPLLTDRFLQEFAIAYRRANRDANTSVQERPAVGVKKEFTFVGGMLG